MDTLPPLLWGTIATVCVLGMGCGDIRERGGERKTSWSYLSVQTTPRIHKCKGRQVTVLANFCQAHPRYSRRRYLLVDSLVQSSLVGSWGNRRSRSAETDQRLGQNPSHVSGNLSYLLPLGWSTGAGSDERRTLRHLGGDRWDNPPLHSLSSVPSWPLNRRLPLKRKFIAYSLSFTPSSESKVRKQSRWVITFSRDSNNSASR